MLYDFCTILLPILYFFIHILIFHLTPLYFIVYIVQEVCPMNYSSDHPQNYTCNVPTLCKHYSERTVLFDKEYIILRKTIYRSSASEKHSLSEETAERKIIKYHPRWTLAVLSLTLLLISGVFYYNVSYTSVRSPSQSSEHIDASNNSSSNQSDIESIQSKKDIINFIKSSFPLSDGMVFPNSSSSIISSSELDRLKTDYPENVYAILLRMAVNEIYARNGYIFSDPIWKNYYNAQNWYIPDSEHNINFDSMNDNELTNLQTLLLLEKHLDNNQTKGDGKNE